MLPPAEDVPTRLHQAMRYAVLDGGKRVRPLLVFAAGEVTEAEADALDRAALAVEFVHAYSLVHDDMPCMDNDVLRRGKPTVHVEFDEATAMLAGDALQAEAFKVIADGGVARIANRRADTRAGPCVFDRAACAADRLSIWLPSARRRPSPNWSACIG